MGSIYSKVAASVVVTAAASWMFKFPRRKIFLWGSGLVLLSLLSEAFSLRRCLGFRRDLFPIEEWQALAPVEMVVERDLQIVDPHMHLWDSRVQPKGWPINPLTLRLLYLMTPSVMTYFVLSAVDQKIKVAFGERLPMMRPYMVDEYCADFGGHAVCASVYIESTWDERRSPVDGTELPCELRSIGEAAMAQGVHDVYGMPNAIVAFVDLRLGRVAVENALQALLKDHPNVRGVRYSLAWSADPDVFCAPHASEHLAGDCVFREGFQLLEKYGLSFDTWIYHEQIPDIVDLATSFPDTHIIVNHCGTPLGIGKYASQRQQVFEQWQQSTRLLAKCPKVWMKVSGLGMPVFGFDFHFRPRPPSSDELADKWRPYVEHLIECFGADRAMFASNFPVDGVSCTFSCMFNAYKKICLRLNKKSEMRALFMDTAVRCYRLQMDPAVVAARCRTFASDAAAGAPPHFYSPHQSAQSFC